MTTPTITAALILWLLFVLAFGMLQQSLKVTLEEGGGVFGILCPQTWTPSDEVLDDGGNV